MNVLLNWKKLQGNSRNTINKCTLKLVLLYSHDNLKYSSSWSEGECVLYNEHY